MSTPPTPPVPAGNSSLERILAIIDIALKSGSALTGGALGSGLNLADAMLLIGVHARAVYVAETGQPYDLAKIPFEDKV